MKKIIVVATALFREFLIFPEGYWVYKLIFTIPEFSEKILVSLFITVLTFAIHSLYNETVFSLGEPEHTGCIYNKISYFLWIFLGIRTLLLVKSWQSLKVPATALFNKIRKGTYYEKDKYSIRFSQNFIYA